MPLLLYYATQYTSTALLMRAGSCPPWELRSRGAGICRTHRCAYGAKLPLALVDRRTGRSKIPEFRCALSTGQCAGGLMGPALRILGPSVMPLVCPLRVPYVSRCPLRVPYVSRCPLRVPYVSLTSPSSYVPRMSPPCPSYVPSCFYVSRIRRDIRSAPLCLPGLSSGSRPTSVVR